ncbi:MAG: right-handed parallel beta-helix repeat-containing protein [Patescibacteria group bacterium]
MIVLIKQQIKNQENQPRSIFSGLWLLLMHVLLGVYHVILIMFFPASTSFAKVNDLSSNGYKTSYIRHCRLQHNVRFGTLAYSLVLVTIITMIQATVSIINPEQFGQSAYAATFEVNTNEFTSDGSCDPLGGGGLDCTIREAIALAGPNDSITFDNNYTITTTIPLNILNAGLTIDGAAAGGTVTINCNNVANFGFVVSADDVTLKNITIENCTNDSIILKNSGFLVDAVTVSSGNNRGIYVEPAVTSGTIMGSTLTENLVGIFVINSSGLTITGNTVEQSTLQGMQINGVTGSVITANTITNNSDVGLSLLPNSDSNTITNNTITNNSGSAGLAIDTSDSNLITGNTITGNTTRGMYFTSSSNNQVSGNTISGADAVVVDAGSTDNIIGASLTSPDTTGNNITSTTDGIEYISATTKDNYHRKNSFVSVGASFVANTSGAQSDSSTPVITAWYNDGIYGTASADSTVDIYDAANYITSTTANSAGLWSITDSSLSEQTTLAVMATVQAAGSSDFATTTAQTPLAISSVVTEPSTNLATISWGTNLLATSTLRYAPANGGAEAVTVTLADASTTFSTALSGLAPASQYDCTITGTAEYLTDNTASGDCTFTTSSASATETTYADTVVKNVTVIDAYDNHTTITGAADQSEIFPYGKLTFVFKDTELQLNDYRLHFVLHEAKQNATDIINKKKAFDSNGRAEFNVKKQQLALEKTYAVFSGLVASNGTYLNTDGLARQFTFSLIDAPQLLAPSERVYNGMPERFVVASAAPSVTVYLENQAGVEQFHCTATMVDNVGACTPPFGVALGDYTVRLVDARGGVVTKSLYITAQAPDNVINTDDRSDNYNKRLITTGQPTLVGIIPTGEKVEISIPQINGAMLADVADSTGPITTWSFTLRLTTLPLGETDIKVNDQTILVYRVPGAVQPAVISPDNNSAAPIAPRIQVISPDDHELEILNSAGVQLFRNGYTNGGLVVDLRAWYTLPGTYTITLRNRNTINLISKSVSFTFTITAPVSVTTTTPEPTIIEPIVTPITTPIVTEPIVDVVKVETDLQQVATETQQPPVFPTITTQHVVVDDTFKALITKEVSIGTVVDFAPDENTVVTPGELPIITHTVEVSLWDWLTGRTSTSVDKTNVVLCGTVKLPEEVKTEPAYMIVSVFSAPVVKIAQVNHNGQWSMTVPAELLTTGEHTVFAALDVNGTQSDQVEIARFVIQRQQRLSNTTWLVIINVVVVLIAGLSIWLIRLRQKRMNNSTL